MVALMPNDPILLAVLLGTIFVIAFTKGGFGGGFAILGIPALSFVMPAVDAAAVIAPLVLLMDVFTVWAFPPRTWSRPNLRVLVLPLLCGIALGGLTFALVDPAWVTLLIALVTLVFALRWFARRRVEQPRAAPSGRRAALWGTLTGYTTFVAHSGGPPLAIYLLPQRLDKTVFAGTSAIVFMLCNIAKQVPYFYLGVLEPRNLAAIAAAAPVVPVGVWIGRRFHDRIDEARLYLWCHLLLVAIGLKLLADGVLGVT
jgi:uncharacterized membrane protein YfcA